MNTNLNTVARIPEFNAEQIDELQQFFQENGFAVINLVDDGPLREIITAFCQEASAFLGAEISSLGVLHEHIKDTEQHFAVQKLLAEYFWDQERCFNFSYAQRRMFMALLGLDVHVQAAPYLRIARPDTPGDNIGLHRDTMYGSSAYELSCFIPFVDLDEESALKVIPGSHVSPDSAYDWLRFESESVKKGSERHKMGYPYAPNVIDPNSESIAMPVPLKVGQCMIFSLSLVHGQVNNRSALTRVSTDIRVVSSWAPIEWNRSVSDAYYRELTRSAVSQQAEQYILANEKTLKAVKGQS